MTAAKPKRLRPGELDDLVLAYMRKHKEPLSATVIAKGLGGRSAGAVANCLARLAKEKKVAERGNVRAATRSSDGGRQCNRQISPPALGRT